MPMSSRQTSSIYIRNFIFGVEDSLVSTVGLLAGIASGGVARQTIVVTGVVLLFVEALSMGVGSLLSEHSVEEYKSRHQVPITKSVIGGVIMFFSYIIAGFVPLFPYASAFISDPFWVSIVLSLVALIFLGVIRAKVSHTRVGRSTIEMVFLGGVAIFVGVIVGRYIKL